MTMQFGPDKDPEDYEYNVLCRVHVYEKTWREVADKNRQHSAKMVALIPRLDTGQAVAFLNAWLPALDEQHYEIAMELSYPCNCTCLGAIRRSNEHCREHHIHIMSTGVEEILKNKHGEEIRITVLPQDQVYKADVAPTIERTVKN